jgi:hypothetical protein
MSGVTNNGFNYNSKNNSFDHDINDDDDDINIDDEELNNEDTIGQMMNEISDSRKRRLSKENDFNKNKLLKESSISPNHVFTSIRSGLSQHSVVSRNSSTKISKIEPAIFFKVHEKPDKGMIEKYLMDSVKDVHIEDFKITANNNVLIYPNSNEDNEKLVNNIELFNGISRLNLNAIDKRPFIKIKNVTVTFLIVGDVVTYDFIKDKEEELVRVGIKEVIEMKNKISGNSYNFVKALVINEEKKRELLSERFIRIGISKIYLEDFVEPPTQCRKYKAIGHIEKNCKSTRK